MGKAKKKKVSEIISFITFPLLKLIWNKELIKKKNLIIGSVKPGSAFLTMILGFRVCVLRNLLSHFSNLSVKSVKLSLPAVEQHVVTILFLLC